MVGCFARTMAPGDTMSSISEVAAEAIVRLREIGAVGDALSVDGEHLKIGERPALVVPKESRAWSWRTTVNRSLLPASVSPESRRHLLYAVLQDLIRSEVALHENTSSVDALAEMDPSLAPFDDVYRVPAERASDRVVLFPIHVAVPSVFDTYERRPTQKPQTDKGFRGKFIEFFSSDAAGFFDNHLMRRPPQSLCQNRGADAAGPRARRRPRTTTAARPERRDSRAPRK